MLTIGQLLQMVAVILVYKGVEYALPYVAPRVKSGASRAAAFLPRDWWKYAVGGGVGLAMGVVVAGGLPSVKLPDVIGWIRGNITTVDHGPRNIFIIHESADSTPSFARTLTALRNGPVADYLKSKGHSLAILDDDVTDADGQPPAVLMKWRADYPTVKLPAILIADATGKPLLAESLDANADSPESILATIKAKE